MDWLEIAVEMPSERVEDVVAALDGIAPGGCSIEEPLVPLGPEEGVRYEPWRPATVRIYLPQDERLDARRQEALTAIAGLSFAAGLCERPVREEDWANGWKEFFHVERVGARLVIRPTWRPYDAVANDVVLDLDPGMAFGTGQHETTRMCLVAVEELMAPGMVVLDLGCGSGILGVAAALLGAERVDALDTESVAVEATLANAARNGVSRVMRIAAGSLDERWPFEVPPQRSYDLALANIHAAASITLAPALLDSLRAGGTLIASGIIAERLAAVLGAFAAAGFAGSTVSGAGEWRAVRVRRSGG